MPKLTSPLKGSSRRKRRAAFGVDAAIMIAFLLAMMAILAAFAPQILQWLADVVLGGPEGAYSLLIELPTIPDPSERPPQGASIAKWVGWAASQVYDLMMYLGLSLLAVALIFAAMSYIFETFKFMSEGTAMNIIINAAFTLILIFAVKHIYNGVAAAINALTGWPEIGGSGLIIQGPHEIKALIDAMGGGVLAGGWDVAIRFFGSIVIFIISTSILILAIMMGAVRVLILGCLVAALPLLLMLRLIPPVKRLADSLIETVMGITFASVIASLLIHFGYLIVESTGISSIAKMAIALATLMGAAYMSVMFAGRLGGLFGAIGGMASIASAAATGIMLTGAGAAAGATVGTLGAAVAKLRGVLSGANVAFGPLLRQGLQSGLMPAISALPAAFSGASPTGIVGSMVGGAPKIKSGIEEKVGQLRAGTVAKNLMYKFAAEKVPGESAHLGLEWYSDVVEGKSDEQIGRYFAEKMGLEMDPKVAGREIRRFLDDLKENPKLLDRVRANLEEFSMMDKDKRKEVITAANKDWSKNKKIVEASIGRPIYSMRLEGHDRDPTFYEKILNNHELGETGKQLAARTYHLMREGYDPDKLTMSKAYEFYKEVVYRPDGTRRSDREVADWIAENLRIHVPHGLEDRVGHNFKELLERTMNDNPYLVANLATNFEKIMKEGGFAESLDKELKHYQENLKWVQERAVEGPPIDLSGFFPPPGSGGGGGGGGGGAPPPPPPPQQQQPSGQQQQQQQQQPPQKKKGMKFDLWKDEDRKKLDEILEKERRRKKREKEEKEE